MTLSYYYPTIETFINYTIDNRGGVVVLNDMVKRIFSAIFIFSLIGNFSYAEDAKVNPTLEKGIGQYKHENYDEALITLIKAREEDPKSTLAAYYLGITYKQLQRHGDSIAPLRDAVTYTPKIKGALMELIDSLCQMSQFEEADKWIAEAEREGIRPAQVAFLKGVVLSRQGKDKEAAEAFVRAKELDPSMEQTCNYQEGICHLKSGDLKLAEKAFQKVVVVDPSSNMASFANQYMSAIEDKQRATRPLKISFGAAWQYDDNVVLQPDDATMAVGISDKSDSREVYTANAEYDYRFGEENRYGLKGQYLLYYGKQDNLGFYDTVTNTFVLQPSAYLKDGVLTFPMIYQHSVVNDKNYFSSPSISSVYNQMFGSFMMGQLHLKYQYRDYLWAPSAPQENRDGSELGGGIGWYIFFAKNKGFVNIRYILNREWTEGCNWGNVGNRVAATVLVPVMDKLNVTVSGDMNAQNFTKTNSYFGTYRKDQVYTVSALAAYKIYKDSEIQLQYTHVKDSSNISVYGYSRNVYSAGVEIKF